MREKKYHIYQYVVDNYAGTEKARTSKNYLAQEQ